MTKTLIEPLPKIPTEPSAPLYFINSIKRKEHFQKHVLDMAENWQELDSLLNSKNPGGPNQYEKLLSDIAMDICNSNFTHVHTAKRKLSTDTENITHYKVAFEIVYGWQTRKKIFFVLARFVRNDSLAKYKLLTGYRDYINSSNKKFHLEMRKKVFDKSFTNGEKLILDQSKFK